MGRMASIHSREYTVFLKLLRKERKKAGLTQIDLAKRLNQTQSFVSKCERGERRLDIIEVRRFCGAIGIDLKRFAAMLDSALSA
jgi:transcriptional regulator with XRE-family HTH domain